MEIILRGVRGGIATPVADALVYGGNTACVQICTSDGTLLFLDAGTGLHVAGNDLPDTGQAHVFITHAHADHIVGLWFFRPLHSPGWITHLYLPLWLEHLPEWFYQCGFFPVPFGQLKGRIEKHLVRPGQTMSCNDSGSVRVEAFGTYHPGGALGYRVQADGITLVYTGDHEITNDPLVLGMSETMMEGSDIIIVDAQYSRSNYMPGFGHSSWEDWMEIAQKHEPKHLVLTHHDPARTDAELQMLERILQKTDLPEKTRVTIAREGMRFLSDNEHIALVQSERLPDRPAPPGLDRLEAFLEKLADYSDQSAILDSILAKSRDISRAEAGTIYLIEDGELVFAYTHNDRLFSVAEAYKYSYAGYRLPVASTSIAGYVALSGKALNLADVHALPAGVPYSFNDAFDRQTGFVTRSMLTLPFKDKQGKVLGVLQLVNSLNPADGRPVPFSHEMELTCTILAQEASTVIERNVADKSSILAILRVIEVHDPDETALHAKRVGDITAEIYHTWALRQGHDIDDILHRKGHLRLAAMLHDVGKVGVPDQILKKPARLTDEEFTLVRSHPVQGASILSGLSGEIAGFAHDIALHHHQKWDGTGYSGSSDDIKLSGEEIPLSARIAAIADVFDALLTPRSYKPAWSFDDVMVELQDNAGSHFDPVLVDCLKEIEDVLRSMYLQ